MKKVFIEAPEEWGREAIDDDVKIVHGRGYGADGGLELQRESSE